MHFLLDAQKREAFTPSSMDNPAINPQVLLINRGVSGKFELKVYRENPIPWRI